MVGTGEENCKLLLWNISTNTFISYILLPGFVYINIVKISLNAKKVAVVATTPEASKSLLFIDLASQQVVGVYRLVEIGLNDLCFAGAE